MINAILPCLGLLAFAFMVLAFAGAVPVPRAPWVLPAVSAVLALAAALVAFGVLRV
jgi:hypothetical protein